MPIVYEPRAVAFLDVLGFKGFVIQSATSPGALADLDALVDLLTGTVPHFDAMVVNVPPSQIPRFNYFSDSIVLSAPLIDSGRQSYSGLDIVVMRAIQVSHHLLAKGYLVRGGIAIGPVWHTATNIVGPAYQEAIAIEQCIKDPCIGLSSAAEELVRRGAMGGSRMCVYIPERGLWPWRRKRRRFIVNGLHDFYIPDNTLHGEVEKRYDQYARMACRVIESDQPERAKSKWKWFQRYLAAERSEAAKWHCA